MKWNRFFALAAGFILAAGHSAALAAEPVCLASIEADTDGNGTQETAELWGSKLTGGSSYYGDLLLMIKDDYCALFKRGGTGNAGAHYRRSAAQCRAGNLYRQR